MTVVFHILDCDSQEIIEYSPSDTDGFVYYLLYCSAGVKPNTVASFNRKCVCAIDLHLL